MVKMITKLIAIFMAIALCACLFAGCGASVETETGKSDTSMFVVVEKTDCGWWVVYHKYTKVMYVVSAGPSNCGVFTVMLNPDGTPMVWEGK